MPSSLLTLLCCLAVVNPASGMRQRHKVKARTNSTALSIHTRAADCAALSDINVIGRNIGQAVSLLCQFWPAKFGEFPVKNTQVIIDLINQGGDLWKKVQELLKGRPGGHKFCWKKTAMRERLNVMTLDSHLNFTHQGDLAAFSNCEMEVFGKCYGNCPAGMKPMALIGGFAPTCSSECKYTTHTRGCGFGCASSRLSCFQTLVDQVGQVTKSVGQVASYMSGNPLISEVVDKVLRLVDFFIDTMFEVVTIAKKVYREWPRKEAQLGIIIALLQFVLENAAKLGQDFKYLQNEFGETLEMVMELMDAEFTWKRINLEFVSDTILKHGASILDAAFEFATVFVFPSCDLK